MKRALSKNRLVATAIILLTVSTFEDAACRPNNCAQLKGASAPFLYTGQSEPNHALRERFTALTVCFAAARRAFLIPGLRPRRTVRLAFAGLNLAISGDSVVSSV